MIVFNEGGTKAYVTGYSGGQFSVIHLLESMTITAGSTISAGESIDFAAQGFGAGGVEFGAVSPVYSSSEPSDTLDGAAYTFTKAGTRTITATLAGVTAQSTVVVEAGPVSSLGIRSPASPVAGVAVTFLVSAADSFGNVSGDDMSGVEFTYSDETAKVTDDGVIFTKAGDVTISAALGDLKGEKKFTVAGAAPVELFITTESLEVAQGGSITLAISGVDEFGNELSALDAVLTSDQPGDVIEGNTVTFPHASPHVITATIGSVSTNITVQVIPAGVTVTAEQLASTGANSSSLMFGGAGALTVLLVGIGAVMLTMNRRREAQRATDRLFL